MERNKAIQNLKQLRLDYTEFYEETHNEMTDAIDFAICALEPDKDASPEMSLKKCLWELRTMRAGLKYAYNLPSEPDEDKEIDKEQIDALNMAIQYIMDGSSVWHSPKAMLPKDDKPVLVVNEDGKYAIAYLCRDKTGDWIDEWRIMYSPYDNDVWEDGEHGEIRSWCALPCVPSFPAFSTTTAWISVDDRLPTKEEYIANNGLFIVSDGNRTYAEYFDVYNSMKYFGEPTMNGFRVDKCVTAWMPLPTPYENIN